MAKFNYRNTVSIAENLIARFGNPVTLTREADMSVWERRYDPVEEAFTWVNKDTGQEQDAEPEDQTYVADGVFVGISDEFKDNSLVRMCDKTLLVVGLPKPQAGDVYTDHGGRKFSYVTHETVNPAGTVVLSKIVVRI